MSFEKESLMRIGYARTSTQEQHLALQEDALKAAGCEVIFTDQISGAKAEKPGLKEALSYLRSNSNDVLVVWKLDRCGRTVKGLIELVDELAKRGIHFQSITDQIDTSTPAGRFFFHVMASLSQMERELIIERTQAGLESARKQGRTGGRVRLMTSSKVEAAKNLFAAGLAVRDIAKNLGVSVPTLYRWLPASERS